MDHPGDGSVPLLYFAYILLSSFFQYVLLTRFSFPAIDPGLSEQNWRLSTRTCKMAGRRGPPMGEISRVHKRRQGTGSTSTLITKWPRPASNARRPRRADRRGDHRFESHWKPARRKDQSTRSAFRQSGGRRPRPDERPQPASPRCLQRTGTRSDAVAAPRRRLSGKSPRRRRRASPH